MGMPPTTPGGAAFGYVTPETLPLFTDLYELTMAQGYVETGHNPKATFDLFFRELPAHRGYVVAAGLEQAVAYIEALTFDDDALSHLRKLGFGEGFCSYLRGFEFTGDVRAVPEGTLVFADEPVIEVTAPIAEAQLLETALINQVGYQSLIATKAARMRDVIDRLGEGQSLVDFGTRRAHGTDAGMKAARASYLGGFDGTSNVAAGQAFGLPTSGTMAHSWIQSYPTEREAFETFVEVYGDEAILLVDTYDTVRGTRTAMEVAEEMGVDIRGVRLDSGDLVALSKEVAPIVGDTGVFISSGMDEYAIEAFLEQGGVATGFGPGTALVTSADAPSIEAVYKLVAVERDGELQPSLKLSPGKVTYPGEKSLKRGSRDGSYRRDILALRNEDVPGEELLVDVYDAGSLVYDLPDLDTIRDRADDELGRLPAPHRRLREPEPYEVAVSDGLRESVESLRESLSAD